MKSIHPINPRIHNRGSYFSRAARAALACVALAAAVLVPSSAVVFADDDTIRTFLSGAAIGGVTPTGHADFRDRGPADRKFQVEVQNVNLPAGTVLNVLVNNQQTATMTLDAFRAGRVELETERGQAVPAVTNGTTVAVTNQSGGTIVSGAFGSVNPTPTPTGTPSATPTPGATPSPTPNASPSPTPNASPTPGATPSPSPTPDATPSPTPGSTPSPTPTPGATPSPTPGSTPSPTPTPGATPSPTPAMFEFEADLVGAPINGITPRGDAEFEIEFNNREFRVRIEDVNLPAGTQLRVLVDGAFIGNISVAPGLDRSELRLKTEDGQTVPQVNSRTRVVVADATGATLLAGSFSNIPQQLPNPGPAPMPTPGPNGDLRIESRLAGAPINGLTPTGHARFRTRADGQRQFNVEAEKVNLPVGTILQVFVDGVKLGELVLPSTLEAELERNSNDGEFVPNVTTATRVVVTDSQGRTLLSGGFNTAGLPIVTPNDIDDTLFFVEQQYRDFLGREADDGGLGFWANEVAKCGGGPTCVTIMRANTSAAFFLSIEFQETGYLLYRLNKASYGTMPRRNPFMVDMQALVRGVVVGTDGWQGRLAANKAATLAAWVERAEFKERFGSMTNEQYVDALLSNAGLAAEQQLRSDLVAALNSASQTRAAVLQTVADNPAFRTREQNAAFVLMQYFGYLHRNPDELDGSMDGFLHWLKKLEEYGGDWRRAEMVRAFIESFEYRDRFIW